ARGEKVRLRRRIAEHVPPRQRDHRGRDRKLGSDYARFASVATRGRPWCVSAQIGAAARAGGGVMLASLIRLSLDNRFLVLVLTGVLAVGGLYPALPLPIDAVPDMTNVQVTVITTAGALSPLEVERYVTYPVEWTMAGLPRISQLRSI